ncbi:MAG TPA: glycosyltransferase family 87 protein [bacterium]|nr:glycosyltransferase family 87 protein [bacterium]
MIRAVLDRIRAFLQRTESIALLAFISTYLIGFIYPIFIHAERMYFLKYFPPMNRLGADLSYTLEAATQAGRTPPYSPLAKVIFQLMNVIPWPLVYHLFTLLVVGMVIVACYWIIPRLARYSSNVVITLIFLAILGSYGFHFELERGQWNMVVMVLVFASLLAFRRGHANWSILLFTLAAQLKLYPFIFVLIFLVRPLLSRKNLIHMAKLLGLNLVLFFILGAGTLMRYSNMVVRYANSPEIWRGNHSIAAFSELVNTYFFSAPWLFPLLALVYLILLALVLAVTWRKGLAFDNKYLFFILVIGSLIIPSVSADYTLPALALALLYFLLDTRPEVRWRKGLLLLALSTTVFLTHYSYVHMSGLFQFLRTNKLPLIYVIALLVAILSVVNNRRIPS